MSELTMDEFPAALYEEWRKQAEGTLEGAPFEKKLVSKTDEGIDVLPIYNAADAEDVSFLDSRPGFKPYARGTHAAPCPWLVAQEISGSSPVAFNEALRKDLERGQTAVLVSLDRKTRLGLDADASTNLFGNRPSGLSLVSIRDLGDAFRGVDFEKFPLFIQAGSSGIGMFGLLIGRLREKKFPLEKLRGAFEQDPLGELVTEGLLPHSLETAFDHMALVTRWAIKDMPEFQTIGVRSHAYYEAGGNAAHEIGFALATAVEYLRQLKARKLAVDEIAPRFRFSFSIGSDFFMSIAKFRAARILWARIVEACAGGEESQKMRIHARTTFRNKSVLDPYVNMLRATTEACAAVLAGCDSLHVASFDEVVRQPDDFSRRIARNVQIILRDECHFDQTLDPSGGSPYIEKLTSQLATKAWDLFREVEKRGGMCKALKDGFPQAEVNKAFAQKSEAIALRRERLIGVNVYANPTEEPLGQSEAAILNPGEKRARQAATPKESNGHTPGMAVLARLGELLKARSEEVVDMAIEAARHGATLEDLSRTLWVSGGGGPRIIPLPVRRLAVPFEQLRAAAAAHVPRPKVFLANMGPLGQYKARADFSTGFFEAGGFQVIDNKGFPSVEKAADAAIHSDARIIVICSTDATYPDLVPPLANAIKTANPARIVVVAGYPKDHIEAFKLSGVDEFIHIRANCYDTLSRLLETCGVLS
jgi:methylmalonyl-CoA mutase